MNLPAKILVPIDFSETSEVALDYAVALAAKLDAKVYLLHVIGIPTLGVPELGVALTASMIDSIIKSSQAAIDKLADARRPTGCVAHALLRTGDARDVILHTIEELGVDLLVMATHGRRGIDRALLGSVAENVVRRSPVPVLTIRARKPTKS